MNYSAEVIYLGESQKCNNVVSFEKLRGGCVRSWCLVVLDSEAEVDRTPSNVSDRPTRPRPHQARRELMPTPKTLIYPLTFSHSQQSAPTMTGTVQISSPAQLSGLLSSSRIVVVNCTFGSPERSRFSS